VPRVLRDLRARKVFKEILVQLELREIQAHKVHRVFKETLAHRVRKAILALQGLLDHKDRQVLSDKLEPQERPVHKDPTDQLVLLELLDL
jgi:hypothetical protein